jgi:hypothetical protein
MKSHAFSIATAIAFICTTSAASASSFQRVPHRVEARNLVEPIAYGPKLSMTKDEVLATFGPDPRAWGTGNFQTFDGFGLHFFNGVIDDFYITDTTLSHESSTQPNPVRLACGIGLGSTKSEVQAIFGNAYVAYSGQYALGFTYGSNGLIAKIDISPYPRGSHFRP